MQLNSIRICGKTRELADTIAELCGEGQKEKTLLKNKKKKKQTNDNVKKAS